MRVCLVGGIFGKPPEYRATVTRTPESGLAAGLRGRGHTVVEHGHLPPFDFDGFDVVHVHHLGAGALAAASNSALRFAFTPHWLRQPTAVRRGASRYVVARAGAVVALSETEARWQREHYPRLERRQHVIANAIDDSVFRFHPPQPGTPVRLLFAGQLAHFKGVDVLLQALSQLDLDAELDLAYQLDTDEPALRRQATELGLDQVRFLGPQTPTQLAQLYAHAHVLVLPSRSGEALPSVIAEALLVGRPVVATDVAGVREQVGDFGAIAAPGDAGSLASAITAVGRDYERYATRAEEVSAAARERYSGAAVAAAHERMYEQLLDTTPGRTATQRAIDASARAALRARGRIVRKVPNAVAMHR